MSVLHLPSRWTRQPQQPVEVDWGNPLARGLSRSVVGGVGAEMAARGSATQSARSITPKGISARMTCSRVPFTATSDPVTLFFYGRLTTNSASNPNLLDADGFVWSSSGDNLGVVLWLTFAGRFLRAGVWNNNDHNVASSQVVPLDTVFSAAVTFRPGSAVLYYNGQQVGSSAPTAHRLGVGSMRAGVSDAAGNSDSLVSHAFMRALHPSEIAALHANPWQLFKPLSTRLYFGTETASGGFKPYFARGANQIIRMFQ